jgi:hypothetical protein
VLLVIIIFSAAEMTISPKADLMVDRWSKLISFLKIIGLLVTDCKIFADKVPDMVALALIYVLPLASTAKCNFSSLPFVNFRKL